MAKLDIGTNELVKAAEQVEARRERVTRNSLAAQLQCSPSAIGDRLVEARADPRWKDSWCAPGAGKRS
jgi:hypothetical protein